MSGIGEPERLRNLGIEVRQALPGVGENLRDHYAPRTRWHVGKKGITFNDRARGVGMVHQALRYALFRKGFLASVGAPMRAFVCSREGLEAPDLLLGWVPMLTEPGPKGPADRQAIRLYLLCASDASGEQGAHSHQLSRPAPSAGDQLQLPVIAARCGTHGPRDSHRPRHHDRAAMASFQVTEVAPGSDRVTDNEILDWVKGAAETTYHPVGTCKMGSDAMAVVDPQLRVRASRGCGSPTPRSCRHSPRATPTRHRS